MVPVFWIAFEGTALLFVSCLLLSKEAFPGSFCNAEQIVRAEQLQHAKVCFDRFLLQASKPGV